MIYDATMVEIEAGSSVGGHIINCAPYHREWFNSTNNELFVRVRVRRECALKH